MKLNDDQRIVEALTGTGPDPADERILEALTAVDYLYGIPAPEYGYDDAVRAWAAKESLKGAAERFMRAASSPSPVTVDEAEQIVTDTHNMAVGSPLERIERTAVVVNSVAASMERMGKGGRR